ncbi:MAG: ABC transporter permease [Acidimicrobiia bacterium]|nr:ABC transporter permease [Acidimicrobiia bacterium]NND13804.1 ABC transporter permease [Acidimicrobiia bacterium]
MGRYLTRRVLQFIPVFIGATLLIFIMVWVIPGDPIRALAGDRAMPESVREALNAEYNLDKPAWQQYWLYISGVFQGDFGTDFRGRPVSELMAQRIPITARLAILAFGFEVIIGIAAGIVAGVRKGNYLDNLVLTSTLVVIAIPIFVLGFLAQLLLGVQFPIFPVAGIREGWFSYLLPALVLGSVSLAYIARLTRAALVENLRADYVRTATSKGLSRLRVVGVHTLRNSMIPVVTFLAIDLGALMGGAIITETIFNIPGIGRAVFEGVQRQEGTVVVGIVTFLVFIYLIANLVVDILYAVLDPRIRYD